MKKLFLFTATLCVTLIFATSVSAAVSSASSETKKVSYSGGQKTVTAVYVDMNDKEIMIEAAFANKTVGNTADLKSIANQFATSENEVIAAINGTFFDAYTKEDYKQPYGTVVSNGNVQISNLSPTLAFTNDRKLLLDRVEAFGNGSDVYWVDASYNEVSNWTNIRTAIGVGPTLLKNGSIIADPASEGYTEGKIATDVGQRSFVGFNSNNNMLVMGTVPSVTIKQLAEICQNLGLTDAINLDGGASSGLLYKGSYLTTPGRKLSNSLIITTAKSVPVPTLQATPTAANVYINDKPISFDAYTIGGNNYFKLRDLAYSLNGTDKQFDVSWNETAKAIDLLSNKAYTVTSGEMTAGDGTNKTPVLNTNMIILDGKEIPLTAYTINGNNYFKLRDIGKIFNFATDWDSTNNAIKIDTSKPYTE